MPNDVKWFKLMNNMFEDEKIEYIESLPETAEEKYSIDTWYNALLDLEEWAFNEDYIPQKVKVHL